jgi:hypothetical protein
MRHYQITEDASVQTVQHGSPARDREDKVGRLADNAPSMTGAGASIDLVGVTHFLTSDAATCITDQVLSVGGGWCSVGARV